MSDLIPPSNATIAKLTRDLSLCGAPEIRSDIRNALSRLWRQLGQFSKAREVLETALAETPESAGVKRSLGLEMFRAGEIVEGLKLYDQGRWQLESHQKYARPFTTPFWDGSPLEGKRLLIWAEQGLGDQVMQMRILPHLLEMGAQITLEADPRLFEIMDPAIRSKIQCIPQLKTPPEQLINTSFDYQTSSFSAWRFLPEIKAFRPAFLANENMVSAYQNAWGNKKKNVGLSWFSGNQTTGAQRSVDLSWLSPLSARKDVQFHSLQYGVKNMNTEQAKFGAPLGVDPAIDQMTDLKRFACQVKALDLVITIDNSVAHLAGSLGVETWLLLPKGSEWRWGLEGETSYLYPNMRLFRSPDYGHWETALSEIYEAFSKV